MSITAQITPSPVAQVSVAAVSVNPVSVMGGQTPTGTVTIGAPAPTGGVTVYQWTNGSPAFVPAGVPVAAGATSATFAVTTNYVSGTAQGVITAVYNGISKTTTITLRQHLLLCRFTIPAQSVGAGVTAVGTVTRGDHPVP